MSLRAACLLALAAAFCVPPSEARAGRRWVATPRSESLGPWLEEGWRGEDWSRGPAIRDWGFSAPWSYDPATGYPSSTAEYPWGYTTPFVRVGRSCVASEINRSPGGDWTRYQRVVPLHYCR